MAIRIHDYFNMEKWMDGMFFMFLGMTGLLTAGLGWATFGVVLMYHDDNKAIVKDCKRWIWGFNIVGFILFIFPMVIKYFSR